MAKLPALVTALAAVDGRERTSVDHVARTIRERGYITTGKRGGGAAEMAARDAANLLIALNGADTPKGAGLAIDRFRSLRFWFPGTASELAARNDTYPDLPKPLQHVMNSRFFGEALDALIEGVPDLAASFHQLACVTYEKDADYIDKHLAGIIRLGKFGLEVVFDRFAAFIEMFGLNGSERRVLFEAAYVQETDRAQSGFYGEPWPDRKVRVTIGFLTLYSLWQALNPDYALPGFPAPLVDCVGEEAE